MLLSLLALYNDLVSHQLHPAPQAAESWSGKFSAMKFSPEKSDKLKIAYIKNETQKTLEILPSWHTRSLKSLEIYNDTNISRGLSSSSKIILHTNSIDSTDELKSVLIHEMGHIVDLGGFKGRTGHKTNFKDGPKNILSDDLSLKFYQISWTKSDKKRSDSQQQDFVSGYAQYDCFEDFAESYLMYRLHGEKFRHLMQDSDALKKKYSFLKKYVFQDSEFNTDKTIADFTPKFDTTLLALNN